jgi:hypothetical protein
MRVTLGLGVLFASLTGCTGFYASDQPDWIVNRIPLESCGVETIEGNGLGLNVEARRCLLEAFQNGDGRELISTTSTEEGDPVSVYYRVHENGTVEIFVDATRDKFSARPWTRFRCDELTPTDRVNPDLANADRVFVESGCEELPIP